MGWKASPILGFRDLVGRSTWEWEWGWAGAPWLSGVRHTTPDLVSKLNYGLFPRSRRKSQTSTY